MRLFKKKNKSTNKYVQPTIEHIENKYNIKLTPNIIRLSDDVDFNDPFYDELKKFGCVDIVCGNLWMHKDCFSRNCEKCNFYPIIEGQQLKSDRLYKLKKINILNGKN